MVCQALFSLIFRQQFAGYLRLSTELRYCILWLPLRRQQSFYGVLFFRAVGNARFNTTDYSVLYKPSLTATRLTVVVCDLRRGGKLLMITTYAAHNDGTLFLAVLAHNIPQLRH